MKMFKRLAAVLLAGAMVLAMFTACGSKSLGQQFEDLTMEYFNLSAKAAGADELENDKDLKNEVYEILGHIDPETGLFAEGYTIPEDKQEENYVKTYLVASNGAPMEITQKDIEELQSRIKAAQDAAKQDGDAVITRKIGVASRVVGGKTYGGFVMEMTRTVSVVD